MSSRRSFLKRAGAAAGAAAFGDLLTARAAFADRIRDVPSVRSGPARLSQLREEYLLDPDVVYLNHASIGTIPRAVQDARARYLDLCETNPWLYMWGGAWEEAREQVRARAAAYLHADPGELAFTHNTTEGFNAIARGLPLGPGDEVLFSSLNHPGASECWHFHAEEKRFAVRTFRFPVDDLSRITAGDVLNRYEAELTPRTRVLVFPHIDNIVGLRYPVRRLAALAHERGVEWVAVDGAQSAGMLPTDLHAMGVDFYAASPHKWLQAPKGLGLLYVRAPLRDVLRPLWVTWGQERWAGTARIFEDYGTRNLAEVLTLGDALAFQERLGATAKEERYRTLWRYARDRVGSSAGLVWRSPGTWERSASLFAVEVRGARIGDVNAALWPERGMVFRAFGAPELNTARLSPNTFTTEEEIDRTLTAMETRSR